MLASLPRDVGVVIVAAILRSCERDTELKKSSETLRLALHISDPTFPAPPSLHQSQGKENTNKNAKVTPERGSEEIWRNF